MGLRRSSNNRGCVPPDTCGPRPDALTSLEAVVEHYIRHKRPRAAQGVHFMRERASLDEALDYAALCRTERSKRHPHQARIPGPILEDCRGRLAAADLRSAKSFEELHAIVQQAIGGIKGIGVLTVYDISHRLGAYLGLEPDLVYLHRGTRDGARALGLGGKNTLDPSELPAPFSRLKPYEIEDCLCIYKDAIGRLVSISPS